MTEPCAHPDPSKCQQLVCRNCGAVKAPGCEVEYMTPEQVGVAMLVTFGVEIDKAEEMVERGVFR